MAVSGRASKSSPTRRYTADAAWLAPTAWKAPNFYETPTPTWRIPAAYYPTLISPYVQIEFISGGRYWTQWSALNHFDQVIKGAFAVHPGSTLCGV